MTFSITSYLSPRRHDDIMPLLSACAASAATGGTKQIGQWKIGDSISTINVHRGLGAGVIVGVHIGSTTQRRDYLIAGNQAHLVHFRILRDGNVIRRFR
jgi:hypothetical protein